MSRTFNRTHRSVDNITNDNDISNTEVYIIEDLDELDVNTSNDTDNDLLNTTKSSGAELVGIYETDPGEHVETVDNADSNIDDLDAKLNPSMRVTPFQSQYFDEFSDTGIGQESCNNNYASSERINKLEKKTNSLIATVDQLKSQVSSLMIRLEKLEKLDDLKSKHNLDENISEYVDNNFSQETVKSRLYESFERSSTPNRYDSSTKSSTSQLYNTLIPIKVPSWADEQFDVSRIVEPPSINLELVWVNGYRGRDSRSNLHYLPTGECIYFVGAFVILYNLKQKTQRHYLEHTDNVKCIAIHPNKCIVASAQSQDFNKNEKRTTIRFWSTITLRTIKTIDFNEDFTKSICCMTFSKHDCGSTLAVVNESREHSIVLIDWKKDKNWRITEGNCGPDQVLGIEFHPLDKTRIITVGKTNVQFWDTSGSMMSKKFGLFDKYDKPKYVLCLTVNSMGDTLTGDSNGNIMVWANGSFRPKQTIPSAHSGGVFSILTMNDGTYLTGGRDRKIIEWDSNFNRTGRLVELPEHCGGVRFIAPAKDVQVLIGTLRNYILIGSFKTNFSIIIYGHSNVLSTLVPHPILNQYLTGDLDGQIHLHNSLDHSVIWSKCVMSPATSACFSPNGQILVVGSNHGNWTILDALTQEIIFSKCDGSGTITCVKFSPNSEYLCLGSSDSSIYIYSTNETANMFFLIGACKGHNHPINEVDWSDDSCFLQSQSLGFELYTWKVSDCSMVSDADTLDNLRWFTHNCTIGSNVIGIWSNSDRSFVNHCDRSNNEDLIASVTSSGNLNLFEWPACHNQCLPKTFNGFVDKYNFVKFSSDDSRLIAISSKSCVTTEWKLVQSYKNNKLS